MAVAPLDDISVMQIELAKGYLRKLSESRSLAEGSRASLRSRFVWFVGICGYALLNGPPYWHSVLGHDASPQTAFWLSMPWVLTGTFSLAAGLCLDRYGNWDDVRYAAKSSALDSLLIKAPISGINESALNDVFNDKVPSLQLATKKVATWGRMGGWCGMMASIGMFLSFLASAILPRLIG